MASTAENPSWVIVVVVSAICYVGSHSVFSYLAIAWPRPLEWGPHCDSAESHPRDVNLIFDEISVVDSLQLMAGFSCNEFRTDLSLDLVTSPNYAETNWKSVVRAICKKHRAKCWTENGELLAADAGPLLIELIPVWTKRLYARLLSWGSATPEPASIASVPESPTNER